MNLSKKLLLGFSSVILLLATITVGSYVQFTSIDKSYTNAIEVNTEKVQWITYSIMETYIEQVSLRNYFISEDEEALENYHQARERFQANIEDLRALADTDNALELIDEFVAAEEEYHEVSLRVIASKQENDLEASNRLMEEGTAVRENLDNLAKEILFFQEDHFQLESDQLSERTNQTTTFIIIIGILALIVGVIVAISISRNITTRVKTLAVHAEEIAQGDLSNEEIAVNGKDEISQLAETFNKMAENLRNIIHQVGQNSEHVAASSEELLASTEETTAATNQVAASITEVANSIEVQSKNTAESAQGMNEITTGISHIAENTSALATVSAEISEQANKGNDHIQSVINQMNTISKESAETNQVIQELENKSSEIGKIIEVITDITEQTNLLALNAAIESARAGEHGKGFAVVADEVRKLAEQSKESANQISDIIQFIQRDTSIAAGLMENEAKEVITGLHLAEETGKMFESIRTAMENANGQTQELSAISEEISASAEQVNASLDEVSEIAKASSNSAGEIAAATEEQLAATEEVSNAATSLANTAEELRTMISKFKI